MGGTDADRSGIAAKSKPPLPPKPPLVKKSNGIIHSSAHSFNGVFSTDELEEEVFIEDSGTLSKQNETKECEMHDIEINSVPDSMEPTISRTSEATDHNMESNSPQIEPSSMTDSLPSSHMSTISSDKTNVKRTVTRGRPPRRISRHSIENGESGDEACCIRFAGMLRTKAVDVATKSKILPPAKPPKPDNLVKLKGRRRKGSQQNGMPCQHSVGDDFSIDGSRHGVRFADDDETESSTDYKDFDENSVFLLELACHCDAQNISRGTGILTEGAESGYYTSDIVKTDEEATLSDNYQPVDEKDEVHVVDKQRVASQIADQTKVTEEQVLSPNLIEERAIITSSQGIDGQVSVKDKENSNVLNAEGHPISVDAPLENEKCLILNASDSLIPSKAQIEDNEKKEVTCGSHTDSLINKDHENYSVHKPTLITDSGYTESKVIPLSVKDSIQKPKRVKSPPRPPPPQIIKEHPQSIITNKQDEKCIITKEQLASDGEAVADETHKEETTSTSATIDSLQQSEKSIPVPEVPHTKKRVTSPPRPPPPKIKEITLNEEEIIPPSVEKINDETKDTEQKDELSNKKQPPLIPSKPDRKEREILTKKSSLEPLDISTRDNISQCTKPLSLSPKTFPRSGKHAAKPGRPVVSQVKKMELRPREQTESKGKPIMTTVVKNTYLEGLHPLPLLKSSSEKKPLPSRPPPPTVTKTEESISPPCLDSAKEQNGNLLAEAPNDVSETVKPIDIAPNLENNILKDKTIETKEENLNDVKNQCLNESLAGANDDSSINVQEISSTTEAIQEVIVPKTNIPFQDIKTDNKLESIATQDAFVRDEIQSSTWPTAAERKKRKQMKSPPRPPPPSRDITANADSSALSTETFSRQTYETSSLDSRGRKRIKSPPRPPPPFPDKLPLRIEEESVLSTVLHSEEKTELSDVTNQNVIKRIKSPPRPPPPVYEKLPLKRIIINQNVNQSNEREKLSFSDTSSQMYVVSPLLPSQYEKPASKISKEQIVPVPLATEETVTEDMDFTPTLESKKRVISPPRPPPPVYEKLSLRRTDKPIVSLTTPRSRKPNETTDSQRQFMSLPKSSAVSSHWDSNQQFSSVTNVLHEYEEIQPPDEECLDSQKRRPKVPPRVKRNRSRTVEVVAVTQKPEERKQRSHSLTESDITKKLEDRGLLSSPQRSELKTLYTTVQKEHGKMKLQDTDTHEEGRTPGSEKMKLRPLPPPPPPPRCRSRSSMSQSPASTCLNTSVSEERKLDITKENCCNKIEQSATQIDLPEYDENANISVPSSKTEEQREHEKASYKKDTVNEYQDDGQIHGFNQNQSDKSHIVHRKSHSPPSTRSKSPSPSKHRSCSSWYDESDVSGDLGDVDTSSSIKGSAEAINKDDTESTLKQKQVKSKTDQSRTSTFYCDLEDDAFHDCATELPPIETERPLSSSSLVEKSVQTSPEKELGLSGQEKDNHSDDTDDLLDRARTVQMELCLMLERRKRRKGQSHADEDTKSSYSYTPSPISTIPRSKVKIVSDSPASDSFINIESPSVVSPVEGRCQLPSTRSSTSELGWQILSSDESDEDNIEASSIHLQKKKQKKAFQIANEIMTSEETFINALKLLNEDFRAAVEKANKERGGTVISEEIINSFLRYFPQLQHLNENLLSELKERIEHWEETEKIADIIVKIGPFLKLYSSYIRDFATMEAVLNDARRKYPLFDQVTKEFESSPQCKKLALKHYMLKPIQRIPLYRLLLQEYLHNLTPESPDYNDTLMALQIVSEVAEHANKTLRQGDNFQKLISIQNSLFGRHEVIRPGRVFLKEGELMKLSRKDMQPRWFILFNDSLLYLTSMQQGLFKVNNELPLAGMKVHIPQHQDYQNEFSIISVTRSFTLAARSLEERQEWIDALNKAIEENASKRNTFATVMMQQKGKDQQIDSSFILGKQAPVWIPDARVTMCQLCTTEFTVTFRRHHCRACGKVVCSLCSANQAPLQYRNFNVARVCDECFEKLQKEFEATDQGEKVPEESGSCSEVAETDSDSPHAMACMKAQFRGNVKNAGKKNKRQLPSVLKEVCANDQGSTLSGYLHRRHRKYWKRFWFVLKDKVLYTYKASEDVAALESVPLLGFRVEVFTKPFEGIEAELLFQLTHPGQFPIVFHADTTISTERWIQAMQHATILE